MPDLPYRLGIEASSGDTDVQYAVLIDGDAEKSGAFEASINDSDTIERLGNGKLLLTGSVWGGTDAYAYRGVREAMAFSDNSRVTVHIDNGSKQKHIGDVTRFREIVDWSNRPRSGSSGGGGGGGSQKTGSVETGPNVETKTRASGNGDSPITYTTGPFHRYIDPQDGDDSWPGTKEDPIKTIGEYIRRWPTISYHSTHGFMRKGTFNEGPIHFPETKVKEFGNHGSRDDLFGIGPAVDEIGELPRDDVRDYVVNARQVNTRLHPYTNFNTMGFHDFQLNGCVQNRHSTVGLVNMVLNPGEMGPPGGGGRMARGYDAYAGLGFLIDCHVLEGADYLANLAQQGRLEVRRCSAEDLDSLEGVINLQASKRRNVYDMGGNDLGPTDSWFDQ